MVLKVADHAGHARGHGCGGAGALFDVTLRTGAGLSVDEAAAALRDYAILATFGGSVHACCLCG
jgi:hypothetical protein